MSWLRMEMAQALPTPQHSQQPQETQQLTRGKNCWRCCCVCPPALSVLLRVKAGEH